MRNKILILALSLSLGACANLPSLDQLTAGFALVTKSMNNPVTKAEEAQVELALDSAMQAMMLYKQACIAGTADKNCKPNIAQIQAYTRNLKPLVAQLRSFVDTNDQINAVVVYNQLVAMYHNVKTFASSNGVNVEVKLP